MITHTNCPASLSRSVGSVCAQAFRGVSSVSLFLISTFETPDLCCTALLPLAAATGHTLPRTSLMLTWQSTGPSEYSMRSAAAGHAQLMWELLGAAPQAARHLDLAHARGPQPGQQQFSVLSGVEGGCFGVLCVGGYAPVEHTKCWEQSGLAMVRVFRVTAGVLRHAPQGASVPGGFQARFSKGFSAHAAKPLQLPTLCCCGWIGLGFVLCR